MRILYTGMHHRRKTDVPQYILDVPISSGSTDLTDGGLGFSDFVSPFS